MARKRADGQNTSPAVMQQRSEANDSLDDFPTPCFATRAICDFIARKLTSERLNTLTVRDPCANRGHMVRPLQEYFHYVDAADVHDYGLGCRIEDYLFPFPLKSVDWTFLNPPFRLAGEFIWRAIDTSTKGVVVIQRNSFLEGQDRYEDLYMPRRPAYVLQFIDRVPMLRGRLVQSGKPDPLIDLENPENDKPNRKASTATSYSALVWLKDPSKHTLFDWICPHRSEFEVEGDYPDDPKGLATLHKPMQIL